MYVYIYSSMGVVILSTYLFTFVATTSAYFYTLVIDTKQSVILHLCTYSMPQSLDGPQQHKTAIWRRLWLRHCLGHQEVIPSG